MSFTPESTLQLVTAYLDDLPSTSQQSENVRRTVRADLQKALQLHAPSIESMGWPHLVETLQMVKAQAARHMHTSSNPIVTTVFEGVVAHLTAAIEIARTYSDAPLATP